MAKKKDIVVANSMPLDDGAYRKFLEILQKNSKTSSNTMLVSDVPSTWRYIDFVDPKYKVPCLTLEWLFGSRGYLTGRIMKLEADEGIGKSSFTFLSYAMGQQSCNAWCLHEESECAPSPPDFIYSFGCDPYKVFINRPDDLETCLSHIKEFVSLNRAQMDSTKERPIIIGIDSISSLSSTQQDEQEFVEQEAGKGTSKGKHARLLSEFFREGGVKFIENNQVFLIVIGQLKDKIQMGFSPVFQKPEKVTIAARPLGFHSSYVLEMTKKVLRNTAGVDIGQIVSVFTRKNKLAAKHKRLDLQLLNNNGFDLISPMGGFMADNNVLGTKHTGSGWYTCDPLAGAQKLRPEDLAVLLYDKAKLDVLMKAREELRIRGFGFAFEREYEHADIDNTSDETME